MICEERGELAASEFAFFVVADVAEVKKYEDADGIGYQEYFVDEDGQQGSGEEERDPQPPGIFEQGPESRHRDHALH